MPNATTLTLATPLDYQVFQRHSAREGTIVIAASWSVPRGATIKPDSAEASVERLDAPDAVAARWIRLPFDARARGFRTEVPTPAGGWYRVSIRLRRGERTIAETSVEHVGVGEVFLIAGQSNSANHGEERQQPVSRLVSAFDGTQWTPAQDPEPGATGTRGSFIPRFADVLVQRLGVPVGVVCIGVGSTSIREWLPAGAAMTNPPTTGAHTVVLGDNQFVSSGELFTRLEERLRPFSRDGLRAILWHQGESDWSQAPGFQISIDEYRRDLARLIRVSRDAAGWDVPWLVAQASYHNRDDPGSEAFRAAQRSVVDGQRTFAGPNTDVLTAEFRENNGQGVHFNAAGLRLHGELWADAVCAAFGWPTETR